MNAPSTLESEHILCIDVGYSSTRLAIWDGARIDNYETAPTPRKGDLGEPLSSDRRRVRWLENLVERARYYRAQHPAVSRIGLCFPGVVYKDGTIFRTNSIWGSTLDDLTTKELSDNLGLTTHVFNDLSAAAYRYGHLKRLCQCETILVLSISSGIGSKTFSRSAGGVVMEPKGRNGEIGLAVVDRSGSAMSNENGRLKGVLGNYMSGYGYALNLRSAAATADFDSSLLRELLANERQDIATMDSMILSRIAAQCVNRGDGFALRILRDCVDRLAQVLHTVILHAGPESIVLTGGLARILGESLRAMLVRSLADTFTFLYDADELDKLVCLGENDDLDNLIGCAMLTQTTAAHANQGGRGNWADG